MAKRGKLELIKDILSIINSSRHGITITPLIRQSNMSTARFQEYYRELQSKGLVKETSHEINSEKKRIFITDKGRRFLEKYQNIISFIEEFEL